MIYDQREVKLHSKSEAQVLLVNEAPGPREAESGIPLYGSQGGNLYRSLKKANVPWADSFNNRITFSWPVQSKNGYKTFSDKQEKQFKLRREFLKVREKYIACTNSYPYWPKSLKGSRDFCSPAKSDVLADINLKRLQTEASNNFKVLLVCGKFSYLACTGEVIENPGIHEGKELNETILTQINVRIGASFEYGWYLGHTRRWSLNQNKITVILAKISSLLNWNNS